MTNWEITIVVALGLLAVVHSVLGERLVLRPLFSEKWALSLPRKFTERLLRFVWHGLSIAWIALLLSLKLVTPVGAAGIVGAVSFVGMFIWLRGHLAWPLFALIAFAAGVESGLLEPFLDTMAWIGITAFLLVAGMHVRMAYKGGGDFALPTKSDGSKLFSPSPLVTLGVATLLSFMAFLVWNQLNGVGGFMKWLTVAGTVVLSARLVGDGRYVGLLKTERRTNFARLDDKYFTPIVGLLVFASMAALV